MSDCDAFLGEDFVFPRRPANRPALARIGYRVGAYPDFVEAMLRRINASLPLAGWTHRGADDPGIALLEGAAIIGDILTFYQEHYANEAFLRTAQWRESVADLVRLLGYRLAPGLGGRATFAFETKGRGPLAIPAGFPLKAELAALPEPAEFETVSELLAWPHLSVFRLYRERAPATGINAGRSLIELVSVENDVSLETRLAFELKKGDRLMLVPSEPSWTTSGSSVSAPTLGPQAVKVAKVTQRLGRVLIELEGAVEQSWTGPVDAYRLGRSFRHFGHNAPPKTISSTPATGTITGSSQANTLFKRHVYLSHTCGNTSSSFALPASFVPLDQEVGDLTVGSRVILQLKVQQGSGVAAPLTAVKTVKAVAAGNVGFGNLNGPATFLTLDSALIRHYGLSSPESDIRDWRIHEVTSPRLAVLGVTDPADGPLASGTNSLFFYGSEPEAKALAGRALLLQHDDGRLVALTCTKTQADFALPAGAADEPRMWPLSFDRAPQPLLREDFDEASPRVSVLGNLAEATQGKEQREAVLGNGDGREAFQTFKLPKAPLTYLLSGAATPPQVPELEVYVNGRRWARVASFFGRGPLEEIYIVREDAEGASWVQFGDGETGARLPSGLGNVRALFRSGNGAHGALKPGAAPAPGQRLEGLDKVRLAGIVSGGAQSEDAGKARIAAPGKVQGLGRLVSLQDYKTEVRAIPGVIAASAAWGLDQDGVPAVLLRVLIEAGREAEFQEVRAAIAHAQRCRGPDRFPVAVEQALLRYLYLDLLYAADPRLAKSDVEAALRAALGVTGDAEHARSGLFGLHRRRLGEREYASRIEGALQQLPGIEWCKVTALAMFASAASDPALLAPPPERALEETLECGDAELLQLHPGHLTLNSAPPAPAQECA